MSGLIPNFPSDGVVTINRVILKPEYTIEDLEERVAVLCENVKTYHSDSGFIGGPLKNKEALIVTFWTSLEDHEKSHRSDSFQPLFLQVLDLCENGNEEIAYNMLWSGKAYDPEQAEAARVAKEKYQVA